MKKMFFWTYYVSSNVLFWFILYHCTSSFPFFLILLLALVGLFLIGKYNDYLLKIYHERF